MKNRFLNTLFFENRQRCGVALLLCTYFVLFALTPGQAQVRNQRRVTGLQLGGAAEGSRVTVVSDTALSDYEAFRRGDRFYVKIPLADFASSVPRLRADGFEDVQVQKAGEGLVVSFKLQPGASARVDQRANKLDVVFSAPNRSPYSNATTGSTTPGSVARGRDAAGPTPPGSSDISRDRLVTDRATGGNERQPSQDPWALTSRSTFNRTAKGVTSSQSTNANTALTSPSPLSSPSSVLSPGMSSSYTPLSSATPAVSPAASPVSAGSGAFLNWRQRGHAALRWAAANRLATLLGALILLSLVLYLIWLLRNRQDKTVKAKQAKTPKVQPKYSAESLPELPAHSSGERTAPQKKNETATPRGGEASPTVSSASRPDIRTQPANASAASANAAQRSQWVLTKPTITTAIATPDEQREEEEREVFEL